MRVMVNSKYFLDCESSRSSHKLRGMSSERRPSAAIVRKFHARTAKATDLTLERALKIEPVDEKPAGELRALLQRYGNQNFSFFAGTPFHDIREIFHAIDPQPHEVLCDAG